MWWPARILGTKQTQIATSSCAEIFMAIALYSLWQVTPSEVEEESVQLPDQFIVN